LQKLIFSVALGLFGLGLVGIGCFPGNKVPYHGMFSLLTFTMGAMAEMLSSLVAASPFKFAGMACGAVALATLLTAIFRSEMAFAFIGDGGTERWVAYTIVLWTTGFGGYLMNAAIEKTPLPDKQP